MFETFYSLTRFFRQNLAKIFKQNYVFLVALSGVGEAPDLAKLLKNKRN